MQFLYDMCYVKLQLHAKGLVFFTGGKGPQNPFSILCMLNSRNRGFNPFFNRYLSNIKSPFADNSKAEPTTFTTGKISCSLKLLSVHFYGQSIIKTVRGHCFT